MIVQELINELEKIEDKNKTIGIYLCDNSGDFYGINIGGIYMDEDLDFDYKFEDIYYYLSEV